MLHSGLGTADLDGQVRALDAATGKPAWQFSTASPIRMPVTASRPIKVR